MTLDRLRKTLFVGIVLIFSGIGLVAQTPTITLQTDIRWHTDRVDNAYMNKQITDAAEQYKEYAPIPRIAFYDLAYPKDKAEFARLNGYGLLLISTSSQDENELPLKRVYVVENGKEIALKAFNETLIKETNAKSQIAKTFGLFRADSIFLFPIYLNSPSTELRIDFAKNRDGMRIASFDGIWPVELSGLNGIKPVESKTIDAHLKLFMKREYPGYFKN